MIKGRVDKMSKANKLTANEKEELRLFSKQKGRTGKEVQRVYVLLLLDDLHGSSLINSLTGLNKKYVFRLKKKYREVGTKALETRKRKPRALLTKRQLEELKKLLHSTTPNEHGFNEDFWTTLMLGELIETKYNVKYKSRTSLQLIFRKSNFTFHKPGAQYASRNQEKIDIWKKETKKKISEFDFTKNDVLLTEDEMMLTTCTTFQKIWLPTADYPKIDVSSNRKRRCVYGFYNPITKQEHAFKADGANSESMRKILNKIGKHYKKKKIVIIWDNASWHKSKIIKKFLKRTKHDFFLINFPPYAPEENPQEHIWKAGRASTTHNKFIANIDKTTDGFIDYLNKTKFDYKFLDLN